MDNVIEMPHVAEAKGLMGEFVTQVADTYLNFKTLHCEDVNPMFPAYIEVPDDEDSQLVLLKHEPDEIQAFLLMMTMEMYSTMVNSYEEPIANDNEVN